MLCKAPTDYQYIYKEDEYLQKLLLEDINVFEQYVLEILGISMYSSKLNSEGEV